LSEPARAWCQVQPQNVGLLQGFTALLVGVVVVSLATEVTDARRSIRREREPGAFAVAVGAYGLLALLCLAGLVLCPRG